MRLSRQTVSAPSRHRVGARHTSESARHVAMFVLARKGETALPVTFTALRVDRLWLQGISGLFVVHQAERRFLRAMKCSLPTAIRKLERRKKEASDLQYISLTAAGYLTSSVKRRGVCLLLFMSPSDAEARYLRCLVLLRNPRSVPADVDAVISETQAALQNTRKFSPHFLEIIMKQSRRESGP